LETCRDGLKVISTTSSSAQARAGCIMANRPSADPKPRADPEAGGNDNWIWFHIPVGYLFAIGNPARLDVQDRGRTRPQRPCALAYPCAVGRRIVCHQRHDLDAGQAADYDHGASLTNGMGL
jgi:hypothetical protein